MKKLLIALAALALPTAALADNNHHGRHDNGHHYGQRHYDNHRDRIRFGIYVNPYPNYYGYNQYSLNGYYGPTWDTYTGYVGCTQYGRNGLLVNRYGGLVRSYEYFNRTQVRCDTRY